MSDFNDNNHRIRKWLPLLIAAGFCVALVILWWANGLKEFAWAAGFSQRKVFTYQAQGELAQVLRSVCPDKELYFEDGVDPTMAVPSWNFENDETEQSLTTLLALHCRLQLTCRQDRVVVRAIPWLERSYQATDAWVHRRLGVRLWPNRHAFDDDE